MRDQRDATPATPQPEPAAAGAAADKARHVGSWPIEERATSMGIGTASVAPWFSIGFAPRSRVRRHTS